MTYEKAMAEVVEFDNADVITTSGGHWCKTPGYADGGCKMGSYVCGDALSRYVSPWSEDD